jgi:phage terminase small subunit
VPGGRPRKSVEQHVLDGTYRKDRHGPLTPENTPATAPPPPVPSNLTTAERAAWKQLTALLAGVVKPRDTPTLVELCRWMARADLIAVALAAVKPGAKGFAQLLTAAAIATDKVAVLSGRFGLSPSDRAKLGADVHTPAPAQVKTRPRTALDGQAPPKD